MSTEALVDLLSRGNTSEVDLVNEEDFIINLQNRVLIIQEEPKGAWFQFYFNTNFFI